MAAAVQKQTVAASNLANVDTPGFRTREASFRDALQDELHPGVAATNPKHLGGRPEGAAETKEAAGLGGRRDGNNVQLDRELLALTRASGEFTAAQTALSAKFRLVRYAINEGR
jgi:flagellar basal-body rod protein FlgB